MQIYGPAHLHGAQAISPPHTSRVSNPSAANMPASIHDELDISEAGRLVDQVRDVPEMRLDRIRQIRAEIAAGTYETDEKLEIALGRMLDETA
ncbi:MAG: flagellar biosynthesis anti-sigma factor FlgM [Pirellulales bacterium]|nr:flagellar biosynthesis anti-sigma factor FlgM [Pirellulales bacterium]